MLSLLPALLLLLLPDLALAQSSGYIGYTLSSSGDPESATYSTDSTPANVSTTNPPPDVFLNATVHVTEIDLTVSNLTAKINLDAQVLSLLDFNAGVSASIDRVELLIQNVDANVVLEARLENVVSMIGDVLDSLDLNPVLATLGQDVGEIINTTVGGLTGATGSTGSTGSNSSLSSRDNNAADPLGYNIAHGILYSVNNYAGQTHTNRMLTQTGSIVDQSLDNNGRVTKTAMVGSYATDMQPNGYEITVTRDGREVREVEYTYKPFPGLSAISAIYFDAQGVVVGTQVLAESSAGGTSTVGNGS